MRAINMGDERGSRMLLFHSYHSSSNSLTTILPFTRPSLSSSNISFISSNRRMLISTLTLPSATNAKARFASALVPTDDPTIRDDVTTSWLESTVNLPSLGRPTQTRVERNPRYSSACWAQIDRCRERDGQNELTC